MNPNALAALARYREENKGKSKEPKVINPIVKLRMNPTSRPQAIKAMCAFCVGCTETHLEPGWRESIKNCTARQCPLYDFRLGAKKAENEC